VCDLDSGVTQGQFRGNSGVENQGANSYKAKGVGC
jgi:hypothetical protein